MTSESIVNFFDQTPDTLAEHFAAWGLPAFRARQVMKWVYEKHTADLAAMTDLGKRERELLADKIVFAAGREVRRQSASDGTQKLLLAWPSLSAPPASPSTSLPIVDVNPSLALSGEPTTECVMIPAPGSKDSRSRRTACVSSQVGCPVRCSFCASGLAGLEGNLTAGQIVEQVWRLGALEAVGRISHVVFMGMGEPLSNFEAVTRAIATLTADWGLGISARRITVSTVGLPAQIRRLAELELPITLALSLHAPNDALRKQIIPWAEFVTIPQLLEACRFYFQATGREITLEYILLGGVNDQPLHARELTELARSLRGKVNLIRYNEVPTLDFRRPRDEDVRRFQEILRQAGVNVQIRASRGRDIAAACGQLRQEHQHAKPG